MNSLLYNTHMCALFLPWQYWRYTFWSISWLFLVVSSAPSAPPSVPVLVVGAGVVAGMSTTPLTSSTGVDASSRWRVPSRDDFFAVTDGEDEAEEDELRKLLCMCVRLVTRARERRQATEKRAVGAPEVVANPKTRTRPAPTDPKFTTRKSS